jgi:hypothetical protein
LSKLFVQRSLAKFDDYEQLVKPLKDYYETKGAEIIEQNFHLHSEFCRQHLEFFNVECRALVIYLSSKSRAEHVRDDFHHSANPLRYSCYTDIPYKLKKQFLYLQAKN